MRFQLTLGGPINDIILHVKMHDNSHKDQQESLGILGVNLIYSAYFHHNDLVFNIFHRHTMEKLFRI